MLFRVPKKVDGFDLTDDDRESIARRMLVSPTFLTFAVMMIFPWLVWCGVFFFGANIVIHDFSGPGTGGHSGMFALVTLGSFAAAALCFLVVLAVFNRRFVRVRRLTMRELGFPICIACGHNLTGLEADPNARHCPECGAEIGERPITEAPDTGT